MITYNPKSWLKLIFALHKSDTLRMLWKELLYMGGFTLLLCYLVMTYLPDDAVLEKLISVYSVVGFVISLLLVFRTNTAYDRWWEGRKKWGAFVNDTRNFATKLSAIDLADDDRKFFKRMIPNFIIASKEHLREGVLFDELNLTPDELKWLKTKAHAPASMVALMQKRLVHLKNQEKFSMGIYLALDHNLNAFLDSLGACERIKNTPIPFSYSLFLKKFIFIYVTTLPLAFVPNFGYFAALIATFVFYVLVSMEVLAEEIEDPFGKDDNDLPTDQLSNKMKTVVEDILSGE